MATFTTGQVLTAAQMNQIGDDSGWITISSFTNGWTAGTVTPAYRRVGTRVQLRGRIVAGSAGSAFTLPSGTPGYRPGTTIVVNTATNSNANAVQIDTNGNVTPNATVTTSLDGIFFYTD
jgi:hypothetical protein